MSPDARLRSLERSAASGDLDSQARSLLERVRAGTLTRERLELAAYCGDAAARCALDGGPPSYGHARGLGPGGCLPAGCCWACGWINLQYGMEGLGRWGEMALVRASLAAAEVAHRVPSSRWQDDPALDPALHAIVAARRWLAHPDQAHETVWRIISARGEGMPLWAPTIWVRQLHTPHGEPSWSRSAYDAVVQARLTAGEQISDAIKVALIAWALGPSPSPPAPHVDPDPETTGA